MKKSLLFAFVAGVIALAGCAKDTELYNKVDELDQRVSKLEEQVKELNEQTVPGIRTLVAAIQGNVYATSVVDNGDGYTIKFSNGTEATIKNGADGKDGKDGEKGETGDTPVISCAEFEGEFYWTVNGEFLTDADGNKIPVHKTLPTFKIIDGKWNVSYDNGTTWEVVPQMGESEAIPISIVDAEDTVTFYIGEEAYVIKKEVAFYLVFEQRTDLGVVEGQTSSFPYTIKGVAEGDEVEVDILNVIGTWDAEVVATDNKSGNVKVTNNGGNAKVFVYAANGRGKTDIKSLVFEGGELSATISAESVSYEGGEIKLDITTNVNYEVNIDADWLTVAPETKATHTDSLTLVAKANTLSQARTATVSIVGDGVNKEFEVIQEAAPEPGYEIDITITNITSNSATFLFTPSDDEVFYFTSIQEAAWVEQYGSLEELTAADIAFYVEQYEAIYNEAPDTYNAMFGVSSLEEFIFVINSNQGEAGGTLTYFKPATKYYAYAYCVDKNLNVISDTFIKDFTTEEAPSGNGTYEDYLGEWVLGTNVLTISEKEKGKSYNVTGFSNMTNPTFNYSIAAVEASFENGLFILKEQYFTETGYYASYGNLDIALTGIDAAGNPSYPWTTVTPAVLISGNYDKANNVIDVTSDFVKIVYSWIIQSGANAGRGNYNVDAAAITSTMTKPKGMPEELFGTYVCPEATEAFTEGTTYTNWTWVVKKEGVGVAIEGYDVSLDEICEANKLTKCVPVLTWDESTSTLTLADKTATGLTTGGADVVWRGILDGYYDDTVWDVDLDAGTITLASDGFQARTSTGAHSYFNAPLVFTKTSSAPASVKSTGKPHASGISVESKSVADPAYKIAAASENVFGIQKTAAFKK